VLARILQKQKKGQKAIKSLLFFMIAGSIEISNQLISDFIETVEFVDFLNDLDLVKRINYITLL